jgi:hypothetical protein
VELNILRLPKILFLFDYAESSSTPEAEKLFNYMVTTEQEHDNLLEIMIDNNKIELFTKIVQKLKYRDKTIFHRIIKISGIPIEYINVVVQLPNSHTIVNTPNILLGKKILNISDEFKNKYKSAQDYFKDPPVNNEFGELKWNKPNFEGLSKLLIEKYSYSKYSINKLLINQLSGGHYKKIAGKNSKELYINNEFSTSMNILNINIPNNCDIDDQFIDDIDTVSDSSAVNEILNIINKNNIKHLLNVAPTI